MSDSFEYMGCNAVCSILSTVPKMPEMLFAWNRLETVDVIVLVMFFSQEMTQDMSKRLQECVSRMFVLQQEKGILPYKQNDSVKMRGY